MRKKIIFVFLFLLFILFVISLFNFSSAFSYVYHYEDASGNTVDKNIEFRDIDFKQYYAIVAWNNGSVFTITIATGEVEPICSASGSLVFPVVYDTYEYWSNTNSVFHHENRANTGIGFNSQYCTPLEANFDVKNEQGDVIFGCNVKTSFDLDIKPAEKTKNVPVRIFSGYFDVDRENSLGVRVPGYWLEVSLDNKEWSISDYDFSEDGLSCRFVYDAYKNASYYFRFWDKDNEKYIHFQTINIDNIVYTQDTVDNYVDGKFDPTPFLGYEYVSDDEIYITTQKFFIYELIDLQCYYAKDIDIKKDFNDKTKWTKVETRVFQDELSKEDVYQFYFSVKNNEFDGNGIYYVRFYNVFLDKWTWSSIEIDFNAILQTDGSLLFRYVNFFRQRFGFLVYPFDLAINVLNKMKNISFEEPAFDIPDLQEPFTKQKIISSTHFSFNTLLENDVFRNIHDIYLIVVDVIIVFALVNLLKNKIMGVFNK